MILEPGTVLAAYRVERVLDAGGMGVVYRARHIDLDRPVALKVIQGRLARDERFRRRFRREGRMAAALEHPNVVTVYDAGEADGELYIAMRLIEGSSLDAMLQAGPLRPEHALALLTPVAGALDHAHDRGLLHRDIKPSNILVSRGGEAFLSDFGISKALGATTLTLQGALVGTERYAAPEQFRGEAATARSDIYSMAAVLFECLTGAAPFEDDTRADRAGACHQLHSLLARKAKEELPPGIDAVLARGLAPAPDDRYPTAAALLTEATRLVEASSPNAPFRRAPDALSPAELEPPRATPATAGVDRTPRLSDNIPTAPPDTAAPTLPRTRPQQEPPAETRPRDRRAPSWLAPAAVAISLTAGGFLASAGAREAIERSPQLMESAFVQLRTADWTPTRQTIEGLALDRPLMLSSSAETGVVIGAAGRADAPSAGPNPAPEPLQQRYGRALRPQVVRLAAGRGLAYDARDGGRRLRLFMIPTTRGYATLACEGTASDTRARCDALAGSLRIRGADAIPPGPSIDYGRRLDPLLSETQRSRLRGVRALRARSRARQVRAARTLVDTHARLARRLRAITPVPQDAAAHEQLIRAATKLTEAFEGLGQAARSGSAARFESRRSAVARADAALRQAVDGLRKNGYAL